MYISSLPKNIPQSKISIPSPSALKKKIDELKTQAGKITFDADEDDAEEYKEEERKKVRKQLKQLESDTLMLIAPFFNEKNPKVLKRRAKELVDRGDKIKASLPENVSKEFKTDVEKYSQAVKKQLDTLETIIKYKEVEEQQENFRDDLRKSRRELNKLLSKVLPDNSKPDFLKDNNNFVKIDDNQLNKLCKIITDNIKLEYAKKDRSQ
jgi:hypothetical protein